LGIGACLCLFLLSGSRTAAAYRPFDGTDGDVADVGEFELELAPLDVSREGDHTILSTPTVFNLGVIPRMELVLDFVPVYPQSPGEPTSVTDTDFFAKVLFREGVLQGASGPSIALEAGPLLPEYNGDQGFGAAANLIVSERFGRLTLHLNNEAELSRQDLDFNWTSSLIGEIDVDVPIRPVAEVEWETETATGSDTYSALGGLIWTAMDGLDLDLAARAGSADGEGFFEARFGVTWAVQVWGADEPPDASSDTARAIISGHPRSN
jgi:hypothetical protein